MSDLSACANLAFLMTRNSFFTLLQCLLNQLFANILVCWPSNIVSQPKNWTLMHKLYDVEWLFVGNDIVMKYGSDHASYHLRVSAVWTHFRGNPGPMTLQVADVCLIPDLKRIENSILHPCASSYAATNPAQRSMLFGLVPCMRFGLSIQQTQAGNKHRSPLRLYWNYCISLSSVQSGWLLEHLCSSGRVLLGWDVIWRVLFSSDVPVAVIGRSWPRVLTSVTRHHMDWKITPIEPWPPTNQTMDHAKHSTTI